ncbi:spermidine synthase [Novosphingobium sp. ERN07]|uniref:spermidine synthase n=1 Tax=Novosphingobium sp. ERN07 TaxID=2726187 RepID=UPI001456C02D|nr:spermidine synthase [Novosphingobium sp. ERN07]NLR71230.1 spermidine synthase [Novosphingobium sp. ERN07]
MWELEEGDELLDTARVPNGARLRLVRNGEDFVILLDRNELMSTDVCASEVALAEMTCARLGKRAAPQLLIGGYGLGFTLRAALAVLDSSAGVAVAEIVPEIVAWARGPMERLTAGCLDDPRVQLVHDDVAMLIDAACGGYDAILLDVDNGPEGLTRSVNDWLYSESGLQAASRALRPGGILAVWSAFKDKAFVALLEKTGFAVEVVDVDAGEAPKPGKVPLEHVIFFARKA